MAGHEQIGTIDKKRFWQLFRRQFLMLLIISVGLVGVLYLSHQMQPLTDTQWLEYAVLDVGVLLAASALTAWLKLMQERVRQSR